MPNFTLTVGAGTPFDLAPYVRVVKDDGQWDPFGGGTYRAPAFSDAPSDEGEDLQGEQVTNLEMAVPVRLKAASKDLLHDLIVDLELALKAPGARVKWQDDTASDATWRDVEWGRFEPDFDYLGRQRHNYADGIVRAYCRPYGHTATARLIATVAASGPLTLLAVPSGAVDGDVDALPHLTITTASSAPWHNEAVAGIAVLPHPSYQSLIPAASFTELVGGSVIAAAGRLASKTMAPVVLDTDAWAPAGFKAPLPIPSVYAGQRHRVLALAGVNYSRVTLTGYDLAGQPIGPAAQASHTVGVGLVDLGVLALPSVLPASAAVTVRAAVTAPSAVSGGRGKPGLNIDGLIVLPEDTAALFIDRPGRPYAAAGDEFTTAANDLRAVSDEYGYAYASSFDAAYGPPAAPLAMPGYGDGVMVGASVSTGPAKGVSTQHFAMQVGPTVTAGRLALLVEPWTSSSFFGASTQRGASAAVIIRKVGGVTAHALRYLPGDNAVSGYLALEWAPGSTMASVAVPAAIAAAPVEVALEVGDGLLTGRVRAESTGTVYGYQVSASRADVPRAGRFEVGFYAGSYIDPAIGRWSLERPGLAFGTMQGAEQFVLDRIAGGAYRQRASVGVESIDDTARGELPRLPASTTQVAVISHPLHGTQPTGQLRAELRVRERFTYGR